MTDYCVIYDDPDDLDAPTKVLYPSEKWMRLAMLGALPPIEVAWKLQDAEREAIEQGRHRGFKHDPDLWNTQFVGPRTGPMTEREAIEYLCMKDLPRKCWAQEHNRPMFAIVKKQDVPTDRTFRNAWGMKHG